jgi:hypothetical protein
MESLTAWETFALFHKRMTTVKELGVLDHGLYYLVVILLKDLLKGDTINICGQKRLFFLDVYSMTASNTIYRYLLYNVLKESVYIRKWKKWAKILIREYERNVDVILDSEVKCAPKIIDSANYLIEGIQSIDDEEEYIELTKIGETFVIEDMLASVESHIKDSQE